MFASNVRAAYFLVAAIAPKMARRGAGSIINVSSMVALVGLAGGAAYGATKAAQAALTRAWAAEFSPSGVRVNAVAPGPISGNWEQEWGVDPEHIEEAKAMNPMKRFGDPREIAETVMFLASDGAGYINGQVIHVEGGWVAAG